MCFGLGLISWQWTAVWNLERVMSLMANVMIAIAFGLVFLYTGELAPTTHRGFTNCAGSSAARIGMFCESQFRQRSRLDTKIRRLDNEVNNINALARAPKLILYVILSKSNFT